MAQIMTVPSDDHCWPELVSPQSSLTFAAVWDPLEGMITFSGAHLFDSASVTRLASRSPRDTFDGQSQVLTIAQALSSSVSSPFMLEAYGLEGSDIQTVDYSMLVPNWVGCLPGMKHPPQSPAFASSIALGVTPPSVLHATESDYRALLRACVERARLAHSRRQHFEIPFLQRPEVHVEREAVRNRDGSVVDEGFCETARMTTGSFGSAPMLVNLNLKSAFSVTTTSTNNYVEVDFPPDTESALADVDAGGAAHDSTAALDDASAWTTLDDLGHVFCFSASCEHRRRRLKKRRSDNRLRALTTMHSRGSSSFSGSSTSSAPASPAEVLAREHYNHVSPATSPSSSQASPAPSPFPTLLRRTKSRLWKTDGGRPKTRLLDLLGRCMRHYEQDGWVWVDVTQTVTQRMV